MRAVNFAERIPGAKLRGDEWLAICPAHDDQKPSLTFRDGDKGVVLKCQAGCRTEAVCERLGLQLRELFFETPPSNGQPTRRIVKIYDYHDEKGTLLYQIVRYAPKDFRQRRPDRKGGWTWSLKDVRRVCYRLPELIGQSSVFIVEGEKDCDRLWALGLPSTTNAGGAGKWTDELTQQLKDAGIQEVVIPPDNDDPGRTHAEGVAQSCVTLGLAVKIVVLPNVPPKGDISTFLDAGGTIDELRSLIDATQDWSPDRPAGVAAAPAVSADPIRLTDVGNGQLFAQHHHPCIRYCYPRKSWFVCNESSLWESCAGNLIMQLAKASIVSLYDQVQRETRDERRTKLAAHAVKSENVQRLQAMIDLARSEPGIAISPEAFDTDPWLFSVANGVLDLRTGALRERRRDDLITKQSSVRFDPTARCPTWLRFLGRIFQDDPGLLAYMQHIVGYCLTGLTVEQVFFLLWGSGSNGKSTLLKILLKLFGDYGLHVPADTFLSRTQDGRATPDLAMLQGARLAVAIESDEGCRLAEGTLKQMTGSDRIAARRLYQDFVEFEPTHKILFSTNHKPRVRDNTHAMWRRMRLIPFEIQIPDDEQDPTLSDKLLVELPGILNWAVTGCLAWQHAGRLFTPEPVVTATASYRTEQDVLDDFFRERCVRGDHERVCFADLRTNYIEWTDAASERPLSSKAFAAALQERGFQPAMIRRARHYHGLRLRTMTDDLIDAQAPTDEHQAPQPMQTAFIVEAADVVDR